MANETILIVDADTKSQKVLEVSFKKAGHRVVITDTIAEAHTRIAEAHPSLIICDTELPDGDGLEFCADLKLNEETQYIPLIFLTENRSLEQKMRSFELGADDYLTKPIYIKEVTTRADLLIQRRAKQLLSESDVEEFEGDLSDITMIDLLQSIEKELRSGSVRLHSEGRQGAMFFREGNILDAVCGKLQGEDAVYRLMLWPSGYFVMRYHENIRRADHIEKDSSSLLMEGIRRFEECTNILETLPELHRIFEADYQRLPALFKDLPPQVERLVRLFDGYRRLHDVIGDSPIDDITTLQIIRKLLDDDLLLDITPADGAAPTGQQPQQSISAWLTGSGTIQEASRKTAPFKAVDQQEDEEKTTTDRIVKPPVGQFLDSDDEDQLHVEDEKDTEELPRKKDAPTPERHQEPGAGGGHWKFHWGGEDPPPGLQGAASMVAEHGVQEADADAAEDLQESGLRELEEQERVRRKEEARRLAGQQQRSDAASQASQHEPEVDEPEVDEPEVDEPEVDEPEVDEPKTDEPEVADEPKSPGPDDTQEIYITKETPTMKAPEDERERRVTPLSSPGQKIKGTDPGGHATAFPIESESDPEVDSLLEESSDDTDHTDETDESEPSSEFINERDGREERPTSKLGVPEEIKQLRREALAAEKAGKTPDADIEASGDDIFSESPELDLEHDAFPEDEEEVPDSTTAPATGEFDAQLFQQELDADHVEGTNEFPPLEELNDTLDSIPSVKRNSQNQVLVRAEYELKKRISSSVPPGNTNIDDGLPTEEDPTPAPLVDPFISSDELQKQGASDLQEDQDGTDQPTQDSKTPDDSKLDQESEDVDALEEEEETQAQEKDEAQDKDAEPQESEESQESAALMASAENEDAAEETKHIATEEDKGEENLTQEQEAEEKPTLSDISMEAAFLNKGESVHEFDDDFEKQIGVGSNNWQFWSVVAALLALAAVILGAVVIMNNRDTDPLPEEPSALAEAEEPAEDEIPVEDEEEEIVEVEEAPEPEGLTRDQAEMRAQVEAASVTFAARENADLLGENLPEVQEETTDATPANEAATNEATSPATPEPAPSEPVAEPESTGSTIAQDVQRLRTMVQRDQIAEALTLAREITARAPNHQQAAFLHGQAALYSNQEPEAIEHLSRAERLGMSTGELYLELATAYQLTGRRDEARNSYEKFLEVEPTGRSADEVRSILESQF